MICPDYIFCSNKTYFTLRTAKILLMMCLSGMDAGHWRAWVLCMAVGGTKESSTQVHMPQELAAVAAAVLAAAQRPDCLQFD